jgi:hypothetical protein
VIQGSAGTSSPAVCGKPTTTNRLDPDAHCQWAPYWLAVVPHRFPDARPRTTHQHRQSLEPSSTSVLYMQKQMLLDLWLQLIAGIVNYVRRVMDLQTLSLAHSSFTGLCQRRLFNRLLISSSNSRLPIAYNTANRHPRKAVYTQAFPGLLWRCWV